MKVYASVLICLLCFSGCTKPKVTSRDLGGQWLVNISMQDIGNIETVMTFEPDEVKDNITVFHAYTKKNVDRQILGLWKSQLARWFSSGFKYGSLLHIEKGKFIDKDSISGILTSSMGNYYINGNVHSSSMNGYLSDGKHNIVGQFSAHKGTPQLPLRNYTAIIERTMATTRNKLYDPALLETDKWKSFERETRRVSKVSDDDLTLVMAFFYYSHKYLPFSHYGLLRPTAEGTNLTAANRNIDIKEKRKDVVYMKVSSFGGEAPEIDSAFINISAKGYNTLIVDLRDDQGGGIEAGMAFMRHIVTDTSFGGILLTQKYFAKHTTLPTPSQYKGYPNFSAANYDLLIKGISEHEGICLMVYPQPPLFTGKIYVLTNRNTASTCEPIVYWLQQQHLATIVGEKTAGAMLNGEKFAIGDGYSLFIPTATYYASDGYKIDQHGVTPDINIPSARALDTVLTLMHH